MKKYFIYGMLLAGGLTACEERVNITLPYEGDKIVVNSLMQPDSVVYVRVTRSVPSNVYDDSGFEEIGNAVVTMEQDGTVMSPLQQQVIKGRTYFVTKEKVETGKRYTVRASASGMTPVSANDTLPPAPAAKDAAAQHSSNRVRFSLQDRPGAKDYYRIRLFAYGPDMQPDTMRAFRLDPAFNNNLIEVITNTGSTSLIMDDSRFDGKQVTFVLETEHPINATHMMVEVSALTTDAYRYFRTANAQLNNNGVLVTEPVIVFTNVSNGYGIVAGINSKRLVFKVE